MNNKEIQVYTLKVGNQELGVFDSQLTAIKCAEKDALDQGKTQSYEMKKRYLNVCSIFTDVKVAKFKIDPKDLKKDGLIVVTKLHWYDFV